MRTRLLRGEDLRSIVSEIGLDALLDALIAELREALETYDAKATATFDRTGFHYVEPRLGLLEWMPAMASGRVVSIKTVGYHPENPARAGIPSVLATVSVYDCSSGQLLGIVEGTTLTALRTGAASAVATEILAVDAPISLGLVGAGAQAVTQAHAISRVRRVDRILAYDVDPETLASLPRRLAFLDLPIEIVEAEDRDRLRSDVDVLCTATSVGIGAGPVVEDGDHRAWLHVNAVGADFAGKLELPQELLRRSLVCPDVRAQCIAEGECQQLAVEEIGPNLAELVQGAARFANARDALSVFDSTGWALEDLVAADLVLRWADRLGCGEHVDLQSIGRDPFDPYEILRVDSEDRSR